MSPIRKPLKKLIGQYPLTIYKDGRTVIPAQAREQVHTDTVYVGTSPSGTDVVLCPVSNWEQWKKEVKRKHRILQSTKAERVFFTSFQIKHWDSKGRMTVPAAVLELVGISGHICNCMLVGMGIHFEIWRKSAYQEMVTEFYKSMTEEDKYTNNLPPGGVEHNEENENNDKTKIL